MEPLKDSRSWNDVQAQAQSNDEWHSNGDRKIGNEFTSTIKPSTQTESKRNKVFYFVLATSSSSCFMFFFFFFSSKQKVTIQEIQ